MRDLIIKILREEFIKDVTPYFNVEKYKKTFEKVFVGRTFSGKKRCNDDVWFTNSEDTMKWICEIKEINTLAHNIIVALDAKCAFVADDPENGISDMSGLEEEAKYNGDSDDKSPYGSNQRVEEVNDYKNYIKENVITKILTMLQTYFGLDTFEKFIQLKIVINYSPINDEVVNL